MQELISRLLSKRIFLLEIVASSFFVNLLALATPIYVIQVVQRYVAYGVTATLITLVAGVLILLVFEFFFRNLRNRISNEFEVYNATLSNHLYRKIYLIPTAFFILKDIRLEKLKKNIQNVAHNLNGNVLITFIDAPFSIIFLLAVFLLHYQLGLILLAFLIIPFILSKLYSTSILEKRNELTSETIKQSVMYNDAVTKNITIKFYSLLSLAFSAWTNGLKKLTNTKGYFENKKNYFSSLLTSLAALLTVAIIGWGAVLSVNGELSVGALIGANILAARAIAPIIKFVQTIPIFKEVDDSIKELKEILALPNEKLIGNEIANFSGAIEVNNLSLQYPQSKNPVFENVSFAVSSGEILSITGNNGSGKTSLIKVIAGILPYSRGNVLFDKIDILQMSVNWLRKNISYMPQLPSFIDAPLINNILGDNKSDEKKIGQVILESDLSDYVNTHPQGLMMSLANSQNILPVGIIKRIALARTIILNNQVYIFDEPNEGLDKKGSLALKNKIMQLKRERKTIIIATLDQEILQLSDSIIDMNK